jgi:alcohol dehydrogenase class IV
MVYSRIASTPVTHIGWGAIEKLVEEVERSGANKVLVVADPVLESIGLLDKIISPLPHKQCQYDIYTDLIPEPVLETGEKLVDFARKKDYSLVIGIGGGSALDMAKLAAVFSHNPGSLKDYLNLTATKKIQQKGILKILIPTTSGTGAEVTNISVLALEHTKDVIMHDYLIADTAIVDPELTVTVPPKVTAATGADALTHAIEAFISINANPVSDGLALQAIRLIGSSLEQAVKNGNDKSTRIDMAYGSYLAGLSFFNAGVGAIHALAYPLGGQFHIPHGDSNAVLIPYVMNYIRRSCSKKIASILEALGENIQHMSDDEASKKCIDKLASLIKAIGIPQKLGGFNIPETAARSLAEDAIKQKRLLSRCPMTLTEKDILQIYQSAFSGVLTEAPEKIFQ